MKVKRKPKLDKTTRTLLEAALKKHPALLEYLVVGNPKTQVVEADYEVVPHSATGRGA